MGGDWLMTDINLDKERGDLARYEALRDAGTTVPEAYALMEAEGLAPEGKGQLQIAAIRLLRGVYGLTLEQAKEAAGGGTPFKTVEDTRRFLTEELGYCHCAGDGPIVFLRDSLRILETRLKSARGDPAPFHALTQQFIRQVDPFGEAEGVSGAGGGPWLVMFWQHKKLLSHSRNLSDCHLTRKGEYLLDALDRLLAAQETKKTEETGGGAANSNPC